MFGSPTGLCAKLWLSESSALDAGAAWSLYHESYFQVHLDYIHHSYLINMSKGKLPLYYGIGGRVGFGPDLRVGLRIPLGMEYFFLSVRNIYRTSRLTYLLFTFLAILLLFPACKLFELADKDTRKPLLHITSFIPF